MRKFIVSDLHGCGDIYFPLMNYLDQIGLDDEVHLYINGDLIDRGNDSYKMLYDVYQRSLGEGNVNIHYLGGNHELMMYQNVYSLQEIGRFPFLSNWILNGGLPLMRKISRMEKDKIHNITSFIGNLDIYHLFSETIKDQPILLVHAQAPKEISKECDLKIKDDNSKVYKAVWTRDVDDFHIPHKLGKKDYFTIIGHTPVENGFFYQKDENYLNIDGGCSGHVLGYTEYSKVPVVEIENEKITILNFNHHNEIVDGCYFDGEFIPMSSDDVNQRRKILTK